MKTKPINIYRILSIYIFGQTEHIVRTQRAMRAMIQTQNACDVSQAFEACAQPCCHSQSLHVADNGRLTRLLRDQQATAQAQTTDPDRNHCAQKQRLPAQAQHGHQSRLQAHGHHGGRQQRAIQRGQVAVNSLR